MPGQPRFPRIPRFRKPAAGARMRWLPRLKRPAGFVKPPKNKSKLAPLWLLLRGAVVLLVVLAVAVAGLGFWASRRPVPQVDGRLSVAGLSAPVDVVRDPMGIPHVYATTTRDLFMAQGFVHAQDRFWQMDVARHIGAGRLAEMFGADQVDTDSFLRTLGWADLVAQEHSAMEQDTRDILQAYADGINAYMDLRSPAELAFEYSILELSNRSYDPEPWQPTDTLLWGKLLAWDLRSNMDEEIDRALILGLVGRDQMEELYPEYPRDNPDIVPGYSDGGGITPALGLPAIIGASLEGIRDRAGRVDALTGGGFEGIGSNSWVVGPERSATGAPILANDPHLGVQMPSIWYQIGLHCTEPSAACPWQVTGFSLPGAPGVVIGHNDRIAWGFTNLGPDVMDLYVERLNPQDPNQYEVNGRWVDMEVSVETIEVAGGDPVELTIRSTRHGPVISGTYDSLDDFGAEAGIDVPSNYAISLAWTALAPTRTFEAIFAFNTARSWTEFREAAAGFDVPSQNLVYADVDGNIGYQAPGRIPIRPDGVTGRLPVPGWNDAAGWTGYVPFAEMPSLFNPPEGVIVTANNRVAGPGYPYLLTTDWNAGYRAARIAQLLAREEPFTLDDMAAIQLDTHNPAADLLLPVLLEIDFDSPDAIAAQATLASWDRTNAVDSAGAAIFEAFWRQLLLATFDELPEDLEPSGFSRWINAVDRLGDRPTSRWWDDVSTTAVEDRDDIYRAAFVAAVADLTERLGADRAEWRWGRLHTVVFEHQTLGTSGVWPVEGFFNRGPFEVGGGKDTVNAVGWTASEGFEVDWLPSMRMIVDLGDLGASRTVHTTGQSGHPYGPHYTDMIEMWIEGDYYPMRWDRASIEESAEGTLELVP